MKRHIIAAFVMLCACGADAQLATGRVGAPILPLKPAKLLTCMPAAPLGWTVTSSFAVDNLTGGWITTVAQRDFKQAPLANIPDGPSPSPELATMNVYLTDTGYRNNFRSIVTPRKDGTSPNNAVYFSVSSFPARRLQIDATTIVLNILIKDRYLLEIRTKNLRDEELKKYADSLDFKKLLSQPEQGETKMSNPVILSRVDELKPKNNGSSPLFYGTGE
ncbi:MAG TPA: hypothetical protein VIU12_06930 [Chryseolinea sp.]